MTSGGEVLVEGISFWTPGLPGWEFAQPALRGQAAGSASAVRRPAPEILPPAERRRAPDSVTVAIEAAARACRAARRDPAELPSVFATTHGDLAITDHMCELLARAPLHTSPTKFHNSVHNAAAGYWCIATGCHAPYTTVSVSRFSYAVGLLEAFIQAVADETPVLYVAYDIEASGPLRLVAASRGLLGAGLVLRPAQESCTGVRLRWSVRAGPAARATSPEPRDAAFLQGNAMDACIPLFSALACGSGSVTLALGPETLLDVVVHDGGHDGHH